MRHRNTSSNVATSGASIPGTGGAFAPSLAMLNTGPAIAYRDYKTGNLMFAASKKPDGSGAWTVTQLYPSASGGAPRIQSLALVDGRPAKGTPCSRC